MTPASSPRPRSRICAFIVLLLSLLPEVHAQSVIQSHSGPPRTVPPPPETYVPNPGTNHGYVHGSPLRPPPGLVFGEATFQGDSFGPYFLPPLAPVLGESLQTLTSPTPDRPTAIATPPPSIFDHFPRLVAPTVHLPPSDTLADHIGEIYSVPLSYLFVATHYEADRSIVLSGQWHADYNHLPPEARERLTRYLRDRRAAIDSLRAQLARIETAPADEHPALLAAFAAEQTPSLLTLENDAEALRAELTENGFMKNGAQDIATVRPKHSRNAAQNKAQATVIDALSAAQFHPGLSLDQRLLLHEITFDIALRFPPPANPPNRAAPPAVFFWPAGARIRLPDPLPAELSTTFSSFQSLKAELKKELTTLVERQRTRVLPASRSAAYRQLATAQAPRFRQLESLAEEIRRQLVLLPIFAPPAQPNLPPDLLRRLAETRETKATLHRDLAAHLQHFRQVLPDHRVDLLRHDKAVILSASPLPNRLPARNSRVEATLSELAATNQHVIRRFTALDADFAALRKVLDAYRASLPESSGITIETLLAHFAEDFAAHENGHRYRDYRAAVLQPGLSPAQRRLLFNAAQVALYKETRQIAP